MPFTLDPLPYDYAALEPYIDATTMHLHHDKHHQTYVDKLNAVVAKYPHLADQTIDSLLKSVTTLDLPEADKTAIKNHGGGHANHRFFWALMDPTRTTDAALVADIAATWGNIGQFKKTFSEQAVAIFGSGWMWLVRTSDQQLALYATALQDSPLMHGDQPLIGLDVWEHAYYLQYQNRRAEYIERWWQTIKILG